jgi:hypothetical protein
MRTITLSVSAAALALLCVGPVHAQSFLESLARRAVDRVASEASRRAESAVEGMLSGQREDASDDAEAGEASVEPEVAVAAPRAASGRAARASGGGRTSAAGPAPWPLNPGAATYTGELRFDPVYDEQFKALQEFGKSPCFSCEGGYAFDTFISYHVDAAAEGGVPGRVGRLAVGESFTWRGEVSTGRLEVLSDTPVGAFPCKQIRLTLTKGEESRDALGLYCKGKSHAYAADMWVRVL